MDDHDDAFTPLPSRKRTGWRPLDFVRRRHARFREEWCLMEASGMFGDFGTLLPLLLAMANVGSVAPAAALFWFGAFNVATAYEWDVPMCVQPMKTIAAAAIADGLSAGAVSAAGLFVGACVLALGLTGLVEVVNRFVPRSVVSGIQLGLGVRMVGLALVMIFDAPWWAAAVGAALALVAFDVARPRRRGFYVYLAAVAAPGCGCPVTAGLPHTVPTASCEPAAVVPLRGPRPKLAYAWSSGAAPAVFEQVLGYYSRAVRCACGTRRPAPSGGTSLRTMGDS